MSKIVIKVENLSKQYRLGTINSGTLSHDLNRWWARIRGKEDPYLKIDAIDDRNGKEYAGYVWALRDVNFEVEQGEVLGVIGKNGAGKSTLLKILSKITNPTIGEVKMKGRIASLLEVGTGFHPELTGRENIFLNGAILGMTKREIKTKYDEIVEFSGVQKYINTPVKRYSSGMYVRLAFAVAAHLEPEILVVDEVLAVGDVEFQKKCLGKMKEVSVAGRTVLFVSHNMASVQNLCTRAMLVEKGEIKYTGTVDNTIEKYFEDIFRNNYKFIKELTTLGNGVVRFRKIEATNKNGQKTYNIFEAELIRFSFEVELCEYIEQFNFRIELRSPENLRDVITTTTMYNFNCIGKKPGVKIHFEVELFDLNLRPGRYPLLFWLGYDSLAYDIIWDQTPPLTVLKNDQVSSRGHRPNQMVGYFNINDRFRRLN